MSSTPKNRFWRWVRLREGRTIYKTSITVTHKDGTPCTVTVEGAHAEYVAALANGIRARYSGQSEEKATPEDIAERMKRACV